VRGREVVIEGRQQHLLVVPLDLRPASASDA
jgi:hypothetical protein